MARILIVDDDDAFRNALSESIRDLGHQVIEASSADEALERVQHADVTFLDLRMPGTSGIDFLRESKPPTPVIVLTAFADSSNTIEAIKLGAFDHLTKPVGREDLKRVLTEALKRPQITETSDATAAGGLIGFSTGMREVQKRIGVAASGDITVLIQGETGTGKELVARAIHRHSDRANQPFVAINCAAIPRELLESELFGHVKGAFTGASQSRPGKFREANQGTLFLDEIGDMNLEMQAKILRVLQDKIVSPVGGQSSQEVDVRIVTATHQDLSKKMEEGCFRQDLFFRLNVLSIRLPPLRERGSDILLLAEHFLGLASRPPKSLSAAAAKRLLEYTWPGNVRELENVIRSTALSVRTGTIDSADLHLSTPSAEPESGIDELLQLDYHSAIKRLEKLLLERALRRSKGNRAEAARLLNIHRQLLYTKLKEHGLSNSDEADC